MEDRIVPNRLQSTVTQQFRVIRGSLSRIERSLVRLAALTNGVGRGVSAPAPKRKLKLTPKRRAELKLQGAYMGYLRQLKARHKAEVKALREKKGYPAAIALAKRMAKG